jgi:uncharacterized protein
MLDSEQDANVIKSPERIRFLDAVRGFALLGILLMNLEAFTGPFLGALTGINMELQGINRWADAFIYIFVQGKFWTLFSMMFGISFALMYERAKSRGGDFKSIYKRRLFALLAIGFIHYVFIWEGDILFSYALGGFILLWLLKSEKPIRLIKIIAWYVAPLVLIAVFGLLLSASSEPGKFSKELAEQALMQGHGSYSEVLLWRLGLFGKSFGDLIILIPMVVAMFLLGARLYRSGKLSPLIQFERTNLWPPVLLLVTGISLMLISINIAPNINITNIDQTFAKVMVLNLLAGPLMCLGYFFGLRVLWSIDGFRNKFILFAPLGQMALSNYLAQSIICTLIFYGYGLGYFQQMPRAWHIPFAFSLISLQILISRWWLKRFTMGPAEYVWRWLTYGKRPKFVS